MFLADLTPEEWFWSPPQYETHIAWQVMHIAVAQYMLCLRRVRGLRPEDEALCPGAYLPQFGVGSKPQRDPAANPSVEEIRRVFDGVYQRALVELPQCGDADLAVPLEQPHPLFTIKLQAVEFAPHHEAVHSGQIAMLRRLMNKPPLR
jgi:hypothetical protein